MTQTAIVFPGQGSQKLGMLQDYYQQYPIVSETFKEAELACDNITADSPPALQAAGDKQLLMSDTKITAPSSAGGDCNIMSRMALNDNKAGMEKGMS